MIVFELSHLFYQCDDEIMYSPKGLGLYSSRESATDAKAYFSMQPGFRENQNAFSLRERSVQGTVFDGEVFEAIIYLHSEDYEIEHVIELGLYGDALSAHQKLADYCKDNPSIIKGCSLIAEEIVNKCNLERKEWSEGFCYEKTGNGDLSGNETV